jgi:hypothetical protein
LALSTNRVIKIKTGQISLQIQQAAVEIEIPKEQQLSPKLSDSIGCQESITYHIKEKSLRVISTQWVNTFIVIPALGGIQR